MLDARRNDDAAVIVAAIDPEIQQKPIDELLQMPTGTHGSAMNYSLRCAITVAVGQNISGRS